MTAVKKTKALSGFIAGFDRLCREMLDCFDFQPFPDTSLFGRRVFPKISVTENVNGYTISCELAGLNEEDLSVSIEGNVLRIIGRKAEEKTMENGERTRKVARRHVFFRSLPLPTDVDAQRSAAELKNGVLIVMLPKKRKNIGTFHANY